MLTRSKKTEIIEELTERLGRQQVTIFTDFRGVSVSKLQLLRRSLKKDNAEYKVARKTLLDRALDTLGTMIKTQKLEGEIGVAFGYGDQALPAKTLLKFGRENETFKILGGLLGTRAMSGQEVIALAKLPSREVLLGQVVGVLAGPIRGLASALQANIRNLATVLGKVRDQRA